jgi:hypothetical protein
MQKLGLPPKKRLFKVSSLTPYSRHAKGLARIIYGIQFLILLLSKDGSHDIITSVAHDLKREIPVGWL